MQSYIQMLHQIFTNFILKLTIISLTKKFSTSQQINLKAETDTNRYQNNIIPITLV